MLAPRPMDPYDRFALCYARHIGREFGRRMTPALAALLRESVPPGGAVLDLCCGPGIVAQALARLGYRVTGVDLSAPMLRIARRHAPHIEFLRADARRFRRPGAFKGVVSTFNSLAHVEPRDLVRLFRNVHASLAPGGVLLFDLSTDEAYRDRWRGVFVLSARGARCIVRPGYDAARRLARNRITLLSAASRRRWRRTDLCIRQRCHAEAEVRNALARAGFAHIEVRDAERDLGVAGESGRSVFRAMRP